MEFTNGEMTWTRCFLQGYDINKNGVKAPCRHSWVFKSSLDHYNGQLDCWLADNDFKRAEVAYFQEQKRNEERQTVTQMLRGLNEMMCSLREERIKAMQCVQG